MPVYLQYYFWLVLVSVGCFALERVAPWRRAQPVLRRGAGQDLVWLIFNGHYLGLLLALGAGHLIGAFNGLLSRRGLPVPETLALLADAPLWLQFVVFLLLKDFIEWNVHWLLHNVPWLWEFHKLHHSIEELDWIGNFRFHWVEIVVYKTLSYIPLI
ncbi:MAG: sterol desaturase family protein, partial [Acidobacteriota bacterium]